MKEGSLHDLQDLAEGRPVLRLLAPAPAHELKHALQTGNVLHRRGGISVFTGAQVTAHTAET